MKLELLIERLDTPMRLAEGSFLVEGLNAVAFILKEPAANF